jgi:DNA-binding NarL/FixJ family response regulator
LKRPELRAIAETGDGLDAVQKAQELKQELILLDIGLPNLNGVEAANRIRQVAPDTKIIFLSQNSDKEIIRAALRTGAQGYVLKMDAGSELFVAMAGVLAGDDFVCNGIKGIDSGIPGIPNPNPNLHSRAGRGDTSSRHAGSQSILAAGNVSTELTDRQGLRPRI